MNLAFNPGPTISKVAAAATAAYLRVHVNSSGQWAISGIAVRGVAHADQGIASGARGPGRLISCGGELIGISSEAITAGDSVYSAANGTMSKTSGGGAVLMGQATSTCSNASEQFTYIPSPQT